MFRYLVKQLSVLGLFAAPLLLIACSDVSPQERAERCADEMRRFHRMEICNFVNSYRESQFSNPTVEEVVRSANVSAKMAADFYPWRSCSEYREITSADVQSLASDC